MIVQVENAFEFFCELRPEPDISAMPLASDRCTDGLKQLIDEAFTAGILAEKLPPEPATVQVRVRPIWKREPVVEAIQMEVMADGQVFHRQFDSGPWVRAAQRRLLQLRDEGSLGENQLAYRMLLALPDGQATLEPTWLTLPVIDRATLADCGVRRVAPGSLTPDRPVLVNGRFAEDAVRMCVQADALETGGAALGRIVCLPEPLPATATRVVTILSSIVADPRHIGSQTRFHFSPEALVEAERMGQMRGLGERVITVFHTHGWSGRCGHCNQNANCPLTESSPSLHDYEQLLEQAFTAKSTLLPIAGRKLGAEGRQPVLQVHAWRLGEMRPIRWTTYED